MEKELEEDGFTLLELWRAVKKRIWFVLCAAAVFAVIAILIFVFLINPSTERYKMEFTLSYIGSESLKYPDGSPFYERDIVSLNYLQRAKASSADFENLDIEGISNADGIRIEYNAEDARYVLTAKSSYFKSAEQAAAFMHAIAEVPAEVVKEKGGITWQPIDEEVFARAAFEDRLQLLSLQKQSQLAIYDNWIQVLNETYMVNGKTLKAYRTETAVIYGEALSEMLAWELEAYGYTTLDELSRRIEELEMEKELNKSKLEKLNTLLESILERGDSSGESVSAMIAQLLVRNLEIDNEIKGLNEENITEFEARIKAEYEKLIASGETLCEIAKELYEQETRMIFYTASVESEGGTSLILVGGGVFVIIFLIAGVIAAYKGMSEEKKVSEKETGAE